MGREWANEDNIMSIEGWGLDMFWKRSIKEANES
jgi:hypothetical protein